MVVTTQFCKLHVMMVMKWSMPSQFQLQLRQYCFAAVLLNTTRWTPCNDHAWWVYTQILLYLLAHCLIGFFITAMTVEIDSRLPKILSPLFAMTITLHLIVSFFPILLLLLLLPSVFGPAICTPCTAALSASSPP